MNTLLIIEDEIVNIEIFKELLEDYYILKIAETGAQAIDIVESEPLDIILLDMILPDVSGVELCRRFKKDEKTNHIPVIIVTSLKDKKNKIKGLEAGANDYLTKPIEGDELLLKVKNHLETKNLRDQLFDSFQNIVSINKELKKTNEKKSEILGIAAHDMRSPLTVIMGRADLLLSASENNNNNSSSHIKSIQRSAEHLNNLITGLLDTVTIESGNLKPNKKKISLDKLVKSVVELNLSVAKGKNQELKLSCQDNSFVKGDPMMLRAIMDNLISNAIKFSPPDTTISISVAHEKKGIIQFIIIDEGPGLTEKDKSKIFGRFQRLSARPTGGESSTGLGLSIVKDYIEMHNGSISVESEPQKGCKFIVSIPRE